MGKVVVHIHRPRPTPTLVPTAPKKASSYVYSISHVFARDKIAQLKKQRNKLNRLKAQIENMIASIDSTHDELLASDVRNQ